MLEIKTKRLVGLSDMKIVNGKLKHIDICTSDIFELKQTTGTEAGFVFYDKNKRDVLICHIGIIWKRNKFEVTYGTEEPYRKQGFLHESLSAFLTWVKENTEEKEVWGIPNGSESEHILQNAVLSITAKLTIVIVNGIVFPFPRRNHYEIIF